MLRVIQNKAASAAKSYYSHSDYMSEGQELVGFWRGKAAEKLGLSGVVDKQSFDRLCDNLHPETGKRLTLRTKVDRTVGYDFNFHVPKGVSLAYSLGEDERVLKAFKDSVHETMLNVEADAKTRVRKDDRMTERTTGNLVWSEFVHLTARPVDGVPDPHLHSHCFVFNTTWDDKEKSWKAGQFRDLKRDASYYEAMFHVRLADRMQDLGYTIKRDGKNWDICEFSKTTTDKFSRRTGEIEKMAEELGIEDTKQKDQLGAKSRANKTKEYTNTELRGLWTDSLNEAESEELSQVKGLQSVAKPLREKSFQDKESMEYAVKHSFERNSVIGERVLLTEALRHGIGRSSVEGIHEELKNQDVIVREMLGRRLATTHEVLKEEKSLLGMVRGGKGSEKALNPSWKVKRDWLTAEQQRAVQHVLTNTDKTMMLIGGAGTGKTSLMQEAQDGINATGKRMLTFAPSAEASRGVLKNEGFDATTVSELLVSKELQEETKGNVIWIDEAGLLGTRALKKVMDIASENDARVVLSGDWKQHGSVERGAAMRLVEQYGGITPVRVSKIQRQTGEYREAVKMLSEGQMQQGFEKLNEMGWVKEIEDPNTRYKAIADEYASASARGETVLAVTPTHAEADRLTENIRCELKRRGVVDTVEYEFTQLKPLRLTEAEKTDIECVATGDVIVFHRKTKNIEKGKRFDAKSSIPGDLKKNASKFDVFQSRNLKLAKGDLVRITGNGKTKDGKHALNNGNVYKIKGFTSGGDIRLANDWVVAKDYGFLASGYVGTSHASQGKTVNRVIIAESAMSYAAASREQFYVSVSRGKQACSIYTDNRMELMDAVSRTDPRLSATELTENEPRQLLSARSRSHRLAISHQPQKSWEKVYER